MPRRFGRRSGKNLPSSFLLPARGPGERPRALDADGRGRHHEIRKKGVEKGEARCGIAHSCRYDEAHGMLHTSSARAIVHRTSGTYPSVALLSHLCYNESARISPRRQKHRLTFVCSTACPPVRPLLRTLLQASSRELAWCENNGSPSHLPSLPPSLIFPPRFPPRAPSPSPLLPFSPLQSM